MAPDVTEIDADMPDTLYAFFADELYRGLDPDLAEALGILAAMPWVDRELATELLGPDRAARVCTDALALGILDDRDGRLELHPLASAFMAHRARLVGVPGIERVLDVALAVYRRKKDWGSAIELASTFASAEQLARLLLDSLDELLDDARLSTLDTCAGVVAKQAGEVAEVRLARAALALRQGHSMIAQSLAETLVDSSDGRFVYRGAMLAAAAAHAGSRESAALEFFRKAERLASDAQSARESRWGQLMAATALEMPDAPELLAALVAETPSGLRPLDAVREADKRLALGLRFGAVTTLSEAQQTAELLSHVANAIVRASFRTTFSCALNLNAEYGAALDVAERLSEEAHELRIDFAAPYASLMRGAALAGLRRFDAAHKALDSALREAKACSDVFAIQAVYAGRVRLFLHEGKVVDACALEPPDVAQALPGMRGEVLASRALALACRGRLDEALALVEGAVAATRAIEAVVLFRCVRAVVALRRREDAFVASLTEMVSEAYARGAVDLVVTTYRASPDVLSALLNSPATAEFAGYVVARAGDDGMADSLGLKADDALDPIRALSTREREVYDLVCQGLSTAAIAKMLFISEATVKVHIHHIFDKMGMRTRAALVLDAANRGRIQAAPSAEKDRSASI